MTYNPQGKRWLVPDHLRNSPTRLTTGILSVADSNDNQIVPVERAPSLAEKLIGGSKIVALVLSLLAGAVIALSQSGVALPPALLAICTSIVAVAAALGIGSSGIAKKPADPVAAPKVGPPLE